MRSAWAVMFVAAVASAQVTFVGSSSSTNASFSAPAGAAPGDVLVVAVSLDNGEFEQLVWPAGFRQLRTNSLERPDGQGFALGVGVFTGASTAWALGTSMQVLTQVSAFRGVDVKHPVGEVRSTRDVRPGGSGSPWEAPVAPLPVPTGGRLVWVAATDLRVGVNVPGFDGGAGPVAFVLPAGLTLREQRTDRNCAMVMADAPAAPAVAASLEVDYLDLGNVVTFTLSLNPLGGAGDVEGPELISVATTAQDGVWQVTRTGTVQLDPPAGAAPGDLLLMLVASPEPVGAQLFWPAGYTELFRAGDAGFVAGAWTLFDGGVGPRNVSLGATQRSFLVSEAAWRSVDPTVPVQVRSASASPRARPYSTTWSPLTPSVPTARLVGVAALTAGGSFMASAEGPTMRAIDDRSAHEVSLFAADFTASSGAVLISTSDLPASVLAQAVVQINPPFFDAGVDAGLDAGADGGGDQDAGVAPDAGVDTDAGVALPDAGNEVDAGVLPDDPARGQFLVGCGCASGGDALLALGALWLLISGRSRSAAGRSR